MAKMRQVENSDASCLTPAEATLYTRVRASIRQYLENIHRLRECPDEALAAEVAATLRWCREGAWAPLLPPEAAEGMIGDAPATRQDLACHAAGVAFDQQIRAELEAALTRRAEFN